MTKHVVTLVVDIDTLVTEEDGSMSNISISEAVERTILARGLYAYDIAAVDCKEFTEQYPFTQCYFCSEAPICSDRIAPEVDGEFNMEWWKEWNKDEVE